MLTWSCEQVRAELSAFYDEELPVADRIAICRSSRSTAHRAGSRPTICEAIGEALQATARVDDVAVMPGPQPPADRHSRALERRREARRSARTHPQPLRRSAARIGERRRVDGRVAVSRDGRVRRWRRVPSAIPSR